MDLLLTHGYFLHEDPKELQIMKPYAPLGLLYLSSYLRGKRTSSDVGIHCAIANARKVPSLSVGCRWAPEMPRRGWGGRALHLRGHAS